MLEAFGVSDPGCVRPNNEDSFLVAPELGLYVVADGMGGAAAGERASRMAVETVRQVITEASERILETLLAAFREANQRVAQAAAADASLEGMGTTLVAALEAGSDLLVASVGDSRAYVHQDCRLELLTEDQTWVHEVGYRLGISDEQLRKHPLRNVLTMAVGLGEPLRIHSYTLRLSPGVQVLMCSDGLHGVVDTTVLAEVVNNPITLDAKCHFLIDAARMAGGPDNITAVLLRAL